MVTLRVRRARAARQEIARACRSFLQKHRGALSVNLPPFIHSPSSAPVDCLAPTAAVNDVLLAQRVRRALEYRDLITHPHFCSRPLLHTKCGCADCGHGHDGGPERSAIPGLSAASRTPALRLGALRIDARQREGSSRRSWNPPSEDRSLTAERVRSASSVFFSRNA